MTRWILALAIFLIGIVGMFAIAIRRAVPRADHSAPLDLPLKAVIGLAVGTVAVAVIAIVTSGKLTG